LHFSLFLLTFIHLRHFTPLLAFFLAKLPKKTSALYTRMFKNPQNKLKQSNFLEMIAAPIFYPIS